METFYFILKTAFSLIFNGNCFCCLFSFEKIICSENQRKSKMFFTKEIRCREIALTLLFLELRVHILRCGRYGAETHESGMYHSIFLSMGDPTTRSTGKIFAQSESKIKIIIPFYLFIHTTPHWVIIQNSRQAKGAATNFGHIRAHTRGLSPLSDTPFKDLGERLESAPASAVNWFYEKFWGTLQAGCHCSLELRKSHKIVGGARDCHNHQSIEHFLLKTTCAGNMISRSDLETIIEFFK